MLNVTKFFVCWKRSLFHTYSVGFVRVWPSGVTFQDFITSVNINLKIVGNLKIRHVRWQNDIGAWPRGLDPILLGSVVRFSQIRWEIFGGGRLGRPYSMWDGQNRIRECDKNSRWRFFLFVDCFHWKMSICPPHHSGTLATYATAKRCVF